MFERNEVVFFFIVLAILIIILSSCSYNTNPNYFSIMKTFDKPVEKYNHDEYIFLTANKNVRQGNSMMSIGFPIKRKLELKRGDSVSYLGTVKCKEKIVSAYILIDESVEWDFSFEVDNENKIPLISGSCLVPEIVGQHKLTLMVILSSGNYISESVEIITNE